MYIKNRTASLGYKLIIALLAALGLYLQFATFSLSAWRLFATWFLLIATIYYIYSVVWQWFKRPKLGRVSSPMLQGMLLTAGVFLLVSRIFSWVGDFYLPGMSGFGCLLADFVLPVLIFCDWLLFTKKGAWRTIDPLYWLAFEVIYFCGVMLTATMMNNTETLRYPYDFLNYSTVGFDIMLLNLSVIAVLILLFGYLCFVLDFVMSGKLGEHVVLPKIKTIVVEEDAEKAIENTEPEKTTPPVKTEKPAKVSADKVAQAKASTTSKQNAKPTPRQSTAPKSVEGIKDNKSAKNMHSGKPINKTNKQSKQQQIQVLQESIKKKKPRK